MTIFAGQLKKYRSQKNISQEHLAQELFISRQSISKWENGEATPDLENLIKLAKVFDVTLDELVLNKPVEVKVERIIEHKELDIKKIMFMSWIILGNILLAIFILILFYGLLDVLSLTSFFK